MASAVGGLRASFTGSTAALRPQQQQNARRKGRLAVVAQAGQQQQGECGWERACWAADGLRGCRLLDDARY